MTRYYRSRFRTETPTIAAEPALVPTSRGLLPAAARRELPATVPPAVRRIDDKARIYHPALSELPGWANGTTCDVVVDGPYLQITPTREPGRDQASFDGKHRLRIPAGRLLGIGVAPGEDAAVVADPDTGTVTVASAAQLTATFAAVGELDTLRAEVLELTAQRDAAIARAEDAEHRAGVLEDLLDRRTDRPAPGGLVPASR